MCYHLSRKPISVVKAVLHQNCTSIHIKPPDDVPPDDKWTWCDWAPFSKSPSLTIFGCLRDCKIKLILKENTTEHFK